MTLRSHQTSQQCIHTLAIEMVCCSITSCIAVLSVSFILSNSSIQHTPSSASTRAPPSNTISLVTGSFITAAVRPTPDDPLPVVYWLLGASLSMNPSNWLLATPGSPIRQMLMFPGEEMKQKGMSIISLIHIAYNRIIQFDNSMNIFHCVWKILTVHSVQLRCMWHGIAAKNVFYGYSQWSTPEVTSHLI